MLGRTAVIHLEILLVVIVDEANLVPGYYSIYGTRT